MGHQQHNDNPEENMGQTSGATTSTNIHRGIILLCYVQDQLVQMTHVRIRNEMQKQGTR